MARLFEADDYILVNVLLLFLLINFNLEIGTIYGLMAIVDWIAYYIALDKSAITLFPIEKDKRNRMINIAWAMGAYVAFIFVVNFIVVRLNVAPSSTLSPFEYVSQLISGTFSASPILYGSRFLKVIVWGLLIPIIETRFFFRTLLQWGQKSAGFKYTSFFTIQTLLLSVFFGAVFTVFHIVAKGITNNSSLLVTFIFGAVSTALVLYFREAIQAIFLHIITNTIATMQQLGIGFFTDGLRINSSGVLILAGILLATWMLLFQELPLINVIGGISK